MPSPFSAAQLSPAMRERYGIGGRKVGTAILIAVVVIAFAAGVLFVGISMSRGSAQAVQGRILTWTVQGADHAHLLMSVTGAEQGATCAVRAQDIEHVDVGYALITFGKGEDVQRTEYELRTLAPAVNVELLGCAVEGTPDVQGPQFPAGVVAPEQPYVSAG